MMKRLPIVRSAKAVLVPSPKGTGSISRALIVSIDEGEATVLDLDPIIQNPRILDEISQGYAFAIRFWDWFGAAVFWGGIIASFTWHWWVFLPASMAATIVWRMNRKSVAQFAAGAMAAYPERAAATFGKRRYQESKWTRLEPIWLLPFSRGWCDFVL
jgi:hypothetical protein